MPIACIIAALMLTPMVLLSAELLAAHLPVRRRPSNLGGPPPFAVLMPAHDEASGISAAVAAVRAQLRPTDRLVVIADNCTDATAAMARRAGAFVATRSNAALRGKGFALAYGRDILIDDPPTVVIILDADCLPAPGALQRLAAAVIRQRAAVQGLYLLTPPRDAGPIIAISTFAFCLKNFVRQRGLFRMSGTALLQGTGMAFPWKMFRGAPLATPSLAEDLRLGLDLFLAGKRIGFEEHAHFFSKASSQTAAVGQRMRWEHGQIAIALRYLPRLARMILRRPAALLLALDVAVPPLSLLAVAVTSSLAGLLAYASRTGEATPLLVLMGGCGLFAAMLLSVWWRWGRDFLPARALMRLPHYVLWKLPIYGRLLVRPERRWIRTSREP